VRTLQLEVDFSLEKFDFFIVVANVAERWAFFTTEANALMSTVQLELALLVARGSITDLRAG